MKVVHKLGMRSGELRLLCGYPKAGVPFYCSDPDKQAQELKRFNTTDDHNLMHRHWKYITCPQCISRARVRF